jgi:hypothetical protein
MIEIAPGPGESDDADALRRRGLVVLGDQQPDAEIERVRAEYPELTEAEAETVAGFQLYAIGSRRWLARPGAILRRARGVVVADRVHQLLADPERLHEDLVLEASAGQSGTTAGLVRVAASRDELTTPTCSSPARHRVCGQAVAPDNAAAGLRLFVRPMTSPPKPVTLRPVLVSRPESAPVRPTVIVDLAPTIAVTPPLTPPKPRR